jgi:cytochrome P450
LDVAQTRIVAMMRQFKFATPEVIADPYPMFEATRHLSPVRMEYSGPEEMWAVLSFQHVHDVLRDHRRFSSAGFGDFGSDLFRLVLINDDPPRHTRLRRAVNQSFSRQAVASLQPLIEETIEKALDDMGSAPADFMTRFAQRLPLKTILSLTGIPSEDTDRFRKWLRTLMRLPAQDEGGRAAGIAELVDYLETLIASRSAPPSDDALRPLLGHDAGLQGFTEAEVLGYVILLLVAGTESTTYLVGNAVNLLAQNRHLWDRLHSEPDLVDEFVEETLRLESPVQLLPRRAMENVELAGTTIPEGALVMVQYGSANRDPTVFDQPDRFRMDRDLSNHVAFGAGIHFCLGSPLARSEARLTLRALLRRCSRIEPAGPATRQRSAAGFYGFEGLPLRLLP